VIAFLWDTETTGLTTNRTIKLTRQPEIIEFYGELVNLKTAKVKEELHHLIRPALPISAEVTGMNSITNEMVATAPPFAKVAPSLRKAIEGAPLLIAHNASFDREMVDLEFERLGQWIAWPRLLCTVEQTLHIKGFRLGLGALHEYLFGEPFAGAHRAKVDVKAMTRCCVELFRQGML
jgi:DNA polymerase III epsilon subunit-like protein